MRVSLNYLNDNQNQTIMFTSFTSGDGGTFCSINTSIMMAKAGFKTIILCLDLRRPKIFATFNVTNDVGISNLLIGNKTMSEVIHHTEIDILDFISAGPIPPNPYELLLRNSFKDLMNDLKTKYDRIILDCPPVALVSDALEIGKYLDISLFNIRHQVTDKRAIGFIENTYKKNFLKNIGILYNGLDL